MNFGTIIESNFYVLHYIFCQIIVIVLNYDLIIELNIRVFSTHVVFYLKRDLIIELNIRVLRLKKK